MCPTVIVNNLFVKGFESNGPSNDTPIAATVSRGPIVYIVGELMSIGLFIDFGGTPIKAHSLFVTIYLGGYTSIKCTSEVPTKGIGASPSPAKVSDNVAFSLLHYKPLAKRGLQPKQQSNHYQEAGDPRARGGRVSGAQPALHFNRLVLFWQPWLPLTPELGL